MCRSFTYNYTGITKLLITDAEIEHKGKKEKIEVLWDTGCNISVIDKKLAEKLNLQSVGDGFLDTITHDKVPSKKYKINLLLSDHIEFPDIEVIDGEPKSCDMLIGMDIISQGDLAVSNYKGKTTFIFRKPSLGKFNYENVEGGKIGRNDPCPCGSGRKYKYCCGK